MEDKRSILRKEKPFSYKKIGDNRYLIFYKGNNVYTAIGKDALRLEKAIDGNDDYSIQIAMAKMTGNFKHGNER